MLELDFFADALAYIDNKEQNPEPPEVKKEAPQIFTLQDTPIANKSGTATLKAEPVQKEYSIDDTNNTITVQGNTYTIPTYFNKDMIRQRDKKTVDMVLISLGYTSLI